MAARKNQQLNHSDRPYERAEAKDSVDHESGRKRPWVKTIANLISYPAVIYQSLVRVLGYVSNFLRQSSSLAKSVGQFISSLAGITFAVGVGLRILGAFSGKKEHFWQRVGVGAAGVGLVVLTLVNPGAMIIAGAAYTGVVFAESAFRTLQHFRKQRAAKQYANYSDQEFKALDADFKEGLRAAATFPKSVEPTKENRKQHEVYRKHKMIIKAVKMVAMIGINAGIITSFLFPPVGMVLTAVAVAVQIGNEYIYKAWNEKNNRLAKESTATIQQDAKRAGKGLMNLFKKFFTEHSNKNEVQLEIAAMADDQTNTSEVQLEVAATADDQTNTSEVQSEIAAAADDQTNTSEVQSEIGSAANYQKIYHQEEGKEKASPVVAKDNEIDTNVATNDQPHSSLSQR